MEGERFRHDAFDCCCTCLAGYFQILADLLETSGCHPPFLHNACSPEQVPYFLEANHRLTGRLLIGSDHYYNLDLTWELLAQALGLTPDLIPERETDEAPFDLLGVSSIPANQRMYSAPAAASSWACDGNTVTTNTTACCGRCSSTWAAYPT